MNRRDFVKAVGASVLALTSLPAAAKPASWPLWMKRGKEEFRFDAATKEGFEIARYVMRDVRAGGVKGLPHLELLKQLSVAQSQFAAFGVHSLFRVNSGLRTHGTNNSIEGAARNSFHLPDKNGWFFAADIHPEGIADLQRVAGWMRYLGMGGIGVYPSHLHVDVGPERQWVKK